MRHSGRQASVASTVMRTISGAGARQCRDLRDGALDIGGVGVGHRLHDDRRAAADGDIADHDLGWFYAGRWGPATVVVGRFFRLVHGSQLSGFGDIHQGDHWQMPRPVLSRIFSFWFNRLLVGHLAEKQRLLTPSPALTTISGYESGFKGQRSVGSLPFQSSPRPSIPGTWPGGM
jgi:hypothetical protein